MVKAQNIVPADFEDIARAAKRAWARETSAAAEWTTKEPELGQCAVTALLVQDAYGGVLKRALVNSVSHYWNEVDGQVVDLTRAQFEAPLSIEGEIERERDYVLSNEATAARYALLKNTVVI
jgi:hypothetical protein